MTQATKHTIEELSTLRLPELQAYYAEVLGETTRCPNKKFLTRRITETLAEQAERHAVIVEKPTLPASSPMSDIAEPEPVDEPKPAAEPMLAAEPVPAAKPALAAEPELAIEAEPAGEPELAIESELTAEPVDSASTLNVSATTNGINDKPLTKLTIEELQQRYQDVVGRSTGSSHRRYLIWKIRQAEKGKISVGPRTRRNPDEPAPEFKVLPLRMETDLVERLDQARERLGLKNRMQLFRDALKTYFAAQGENEVAALFSR